MDDQIYHEITIFDSIFNAQILVGVTDEPSSKVHSGIRQVFVTICAVRFWLTLGRHLAN